jgi:GNAT superfamily N-acetyltransferase
MNSKLDNIRIEFVKVSELPALAASVIDRKEAGAYLPITRQRAVALSKNPLADPDDIGMLVVYEGDEIVGYFGMMTILLQHAGGLEKVYWFTTWSVADRMRGKGLGSYLMTAALELDHDYLIVGSAPARRVCTKFGFESRSPLQIAVLDFRLAARYNPITLAIRGVRKVFSLLGRKLDITHALDKTGSWFETWLGTGVRNWTYGRVLKRVADGLERYQLRRVDQIAPLAQEMVIPSPLPRLYRNLEVINWMLAYPWVLKPGQSDSEEMNYTFTDVREEFEFLAYEVHLAEDYIGYLVFQLSRVRGIRTLRLIDSALAEPEMILPLVLQQAAAFDVEKVEMNAGYAAALKDSPVFSIFERIYQSYPASKDSPLARYFEELHLDFADGDMSFT